MSIGHCFRGAIGLIVLALAIGAFAHAGETRTAYAQVAGCVDSTPVQWTAGTGANGHWYQRICFLTFGELTWQEAQDAAEAEGKYLVTILSQEEQDFVAGLVGTCDCGLWGGGMQEPGGDVDENWFWVNNDGPFGFASWSGFGEPNDGGVTTDLEDGEEDCLELRVDDDWNDAACDTDSVAGMILEWEDSDGDDVPDGEDNCPEVANPEQEDTDGDGIGDACEDEDIPDLIITKDCVSSSGQDGDADFEIIVTTDLGVVVPDGSESLDCGDILVLIDIEPGTYRIEELITGPDANNFLTAITCANDDGQTVTPGQLAEVEVESDTHCNVINVFGPADPTDPTDPGTPPPAPTVIVPIDIDNTNTNALNNDNLNTNNNENTNTQEQSNFQEQINDNNQTTTVNSSPSVVIDFDD